MYGYVDGIDFRNIEAMKYWSFPKNYAHDKTQEIKNLIFSGDYYGALKVDGFFQRLCKDEDGNTMMIARNRNVKGEAVDKIEWVPQVQTLMDALPNGTVLLCEAYLPGDEGSRKVTSLLGCLKDKCLARQEAGKKLHFYIFDICAWDGKSWMKRPAEKRFEAVNKLPETLGNIPYVEYATYYKGAELWDKIGEYLESGREGAVITNTYCPIYEKRTPARQTIKIKKEINHTIDCFFTGHFTRPTKIYTGREVESWKYWVNSKTDERLPEGEHYTDYWKYGLIEPVTKGYYYDWAASLEIGVVKEDKVVPIGLLSNLTEEIKSNPDKYKGRCIEVSCMEVMEGTNGLRHAKMIDFRDDLTIKDCTWDKVFGGNI